MRSGASPPGASPQGLTLPLRYLLRKRLKNPAPMEVTERRQVGDAESTIHRAETTGQQYYPARGSDSEL